MKRHAEHILLMGEFFDPYIHRNKSPSSPLHLPQVGCYYSRRIHPIGHFPFPMIRRRFPFRRLFGCEDEGRVSEIA